MADLHRACPTLVPAIEGHYHSKTDGWNGFAFLQITKSAPYPGLTHKNAPPRFVHVFVYGGNLDNAFEFSFPTVSDAPSSWRRVEAISKHRLVSFGLVKWRSTQGVLVLAPPYPRGGRDGGHFVFRWPGPTGGHAVSLHAWLPLRRALATLRAIVMSIRE